MHARVREAPRRRDRRSGRRTRPGTGTAGWQKKSQIELRGVVPARRIRSREAQAAVRSTTGRCGSRSRTATGSARRGRAAASVDKPRTSGLPAAPRSRTRCPGRHARSSGRNRRRLVLDIRCVGTISRAARPAAHQIEMILRDGSTLPKRPAIGRRRARRVAVQIAEEGDRLIDAAAFTSMQSQWLALDEFEQPEPGGGVAGQRLRQRAARPRDPGECENANSAPSRSRGSSGWRKYAFSSGGAVSACRRGRRGCSPRRPAARDSRARRGRPDRGSTSTACESRPFIADILPIEHECRRTRAHDRYAGVDRLHPGGGRRIESIRFARPPGTPVPRGTPGRSSTKASQPSEPMRSSFAASVSSRNTRSR